jgi:hypothetical protein
MKSPRILLAEFFLFFSIQDSQKLKQRVSHFKSVSTFLILVSFFQFISVLLYILRLPSEIYCKVPLPVPTGNKEKTNYRYLISLPVHIESERRGAAYLIVSSRSAPKGLASSRPATQLSSKAMPPATISLGQLVMASVSRRSAAATRICSRRQLMRPLRSR